MVKLDKNVSKKVLNFIKKSLNDQGKSLNGHRKSLNGLGIVTVRSLKILNGRIKSNKVTEWQVKSHCIVTEKSLTDD